MKAVVVLVLGGLTFAQAADIRQLEQQHAAAVRAGAGLERFYSPECRGIDRTGEPNDLKAVLARNADPTYAIGDIDVRVFANGGIAVGTQRVEGGVAVRFLRVWVTQPDGARLVAFHGTPIASDTSYTGAPSSIVAAPRASPTGPPDRAVLGVENTLLRLLSENKDEESRSLKTSDSLFVRHTGTVAATFEAAKSVSLKREIVSWDRVQSYGDIAVVQGTLLWTDVNEFSPGQLRFTRVWVNQGGAWKLAAEQHTSISY